MDSLAVKYASSGNGSTPRIGWHIFLVGGIIRGIFGLRPASAISATSKLGLRRQIHLRWATVGSLGSL